MNLIFAETFVEAYNGSYNTGDYIKTFGFSYPGDGGAALYHVESNALIDLYNPAIVNDKDESIDSGIPPIMYGETTMYFDNGYFYKPATLPTARYQKVSCLRYKLIPNQSVVAEQCGLCSKVSNTVGSSEESTEIEALNATLATNNGNILKRATAFAAANNVPFEFSPKRMYLTQGSVVVKDNMIIRGNDAALQIHQDSNGAKELFNSVGVANASKVLFENLTLVGRTRVASTTDGIDNLVGLGDQAFHIGGENIVFKNVNVTNFNNGIHSRTVSFSGEQYEVPPISHGNWLIDNCSIKNAVMGLQVSDIDGIIIKNTDILNYTFIDKDTLHCTYFERSTLNLRVNNCRVGKTNGNALDNHYAISEKKNNPGDMSKNQFYNDSRIDACDAALNLSFLLDNVMVDGVSATNVTNYHIRTACLTNAIVANSNFKQTTNPKKEIYYNSSIFLVNNPYRIWVQSTDFVHGGKLSTYTQARGIFYSTMNPNNERRCYDYSKDYPIALQYLKASGCTFSFTNDIEANIVDRTMYRNKDEVYYQPNKLFDNCVFYFSNVNNDTLSVNCVQSGKGGLIFRNALLKNTSGSVPKHPAFSFGCGYKLSNNDDGEENGVCPVFGNCIHALFNKLQAYMVENCVFDNMAIEGKSVSDGWEFFADINATGKPMSLTTAVKQSCSYICNAYEIADNVFTKAPNLS